MMGYGAGLGLGFGSGGLLALAGCVLLVVGLVLLVAWVIGRSSQPAHVGGGHTTAPVPAPDAALETLRMRFARGEITADEYTAARQTLEGGR
jgi:uncharacterized membrane protein